MDSAAARFLIFGLGPPLLWALFRLLAPAKETLSVTAEERQRYLDWKAPWVLAYFFFGAVCTVALFGFLRLLALLLSRPRFGALVVLEPVSALWWLVALFLGLTLAGWPTSWWLRRAMGPESDRFEQFEDQQYRIDSRRLNTILAPIFGLAAVVALVAGATRTDQLTTRGIVIGEAFVAHPPLRPYNTVRTIAHGTISYTSRGRQRNRDWFTITFDDGTRWRSQSAWWDADDRLLVKTVVELVSARSGRPIDER